LEKPKIEAHALCSMNNGGCGWWWSISVASTARELMVGGNGLVCLGALLEFPISISIKSHLRIST
jgi:hypothetical protein